jgi:hypothetical protein
MDDRPTSPETESNADLIQKCELKGLNLAAESLTSEIAQCQAAVTHLQTRLSEAQQAIQMQNEALRTLIATRAEFSKKLQDAVKSRKKLVNKCADLVQQIQKNHSPDGG